jgi:tetratricopeptide (TPR) repeat protein
MSKIESDLRIHNFYLIGKENFESGLNSQTISFKDKSLIEFSDLNPPRFKFRETIQEIGLDIKLEYKNYKYYVENETIVAFELFHFKDFDIENLNFWSHFELLFHQWYLYGVSFNTNKIEIYGELLNYLVKIYGAYKEIPEQDNSNRNVAWFSENSLNSIYLEIEEKGNGEKFLVLTYYDGLLQMSLNKPHNIYPLIRNEVYKKDKSFLPNQSKLGFFSKYIKRSNSQTCQEAPDFYTIKSYVDNIITGGVSLSELKKITNYLVDKINPQQFNLEVGDWLINIAVKIQESELFNESEEIYKLFIDWYNNPVFIPYKERIELISIAYKNLINLYGDNDKLKNAIESFNLCIKIMDNNLFCINNYNYSFIAGQANYNIARVYGKIGKQEKAIEHSRKALNYYEPFVSPWITKNEITTIILAITNLGNYLSDKGDYDEAAKNYTMGMRFAIDNKRYYDSSVINMNLANTWVKLKKYEDAEKQYDTILDLINMEPSIYQDSDLKGKVLINFAELYKETKNKDNEKQCLSEAIEFYENALDEHPEIEDLVNNLKKRINI